MNHEGYRTFQRLGIKNEKRVSESKKFRKRTL